MEKVDLKALALTAGLVWGAATAFAALTAPFGWNGPMVTVLAGSYLGYGPGVVGAIVGFIWGFADAAIGVLIIGVVYRWFAAHPIRMGSRTSSKAPRA